MSTINKAIQDLEDQKKRIDAAIRVLRTLSFNGSGGSGSGAHRLSAAGRQRIIDAQKKRWAKARAGKK